MAISRCHNCWKSPKGVKKEYVATVHPVGYPDTAVICGTKGCQCSGLVWLTSNEFSDYKRGNRIFDVDTQTVKVRVI